MMSSLLAFVRIPLVLYNSHQLLLQLSSLYILFVSCTTSDGRQVATHLHHLVRCARYAAGKGIHDAHGIYSH